MRSFVTPAAMIFFSVLATSLLAGSSARAADVTAGELGICAENVARVTGIFKNICQRLLESPELRKTCSEVPRRDLVKCDGSEPHSIIDYRKESWSECTPLIKDGLKSLFWEAVDDGVWALQKLKDGAVSVFSISPAKTDPGRPREVSEDEALEALNRAAESIEVTPDASPYAAHSFIEEMRSWIRALGDETFRSEIQRQMMEMLDNELDSLRCLSSRARIAYFCYAIGNLGPTVVSALTGLYYGGVRFGPKIAQALKSGKRRSAEKLRALMKARNNGGP